MAGTASDFSTLLLPFNLIPDREYAAGTLKSHVAVAVLQVLIREVSSSLKSYQNVRGIPSISFQSPKPRQSPDLF